jgi:hypothetical protein
MVDFVEFSLVFFDRGGCELPAVDGFTILLVIPFHSNNIRLIGTIGGKELGDHGERLRSIDCEFCAKSV